jgi:succinyl-diaminopimelate desuccinylase
LGHTDTVPAGSLWSVDPFSGIIKNNRIYGLGSTDMKSGIAALLSAVNTTGLPDDVLILLYGDEEYSFQGMKKIVSDFTSWNPDMLISIDGKKEEIGYAGRGLIEVSFTLIGKTAHASRPDKGMNGIEYGVQIVQQLRNELSRYSSVELGKTTVNLGDSLAECVQKMALCSVSQMPYLILLR